MSNKVVVVGDKFAAFAQNKSVVCASALEARLRDDDTDLGDSRFELGQGVSAPEIERLVSLAEAVGRREQLLFAASRKCGTGDVHKTRPENSMLSIPVERDGSTFESDLLVDDDSELLSDHVAGQHLPGMVLVEAIRQMGLAVMEQHFTGDFPHGCAFLWTSFQIDFLQYAFPVKTLVICRVRDRQMVKSRRVVMRFQFECLQGGLAVASSQSSCELYDRRVIERQEKGLAAAASIATSSNPVRIAS